MRGNVGYEPGSASSVASDKLLNPSEPQIPHLSNEITNSYYLWLLGGCHMQPCLVHCGMLRHWPLCPLQP